jgi:hypothetical protein
MYQNSTKLNQTIKIISNTGIEFGLFLELYVGVKTPKYSLSDYGAIVFIHNQTSLPESNAGIILKPSTQTNIAVEKTFNSYAPSPYSECHDFNTFTFNRTYYNAILKEFLSYSRSICLDLCLKQQIIAICNCSYLEFIQIQNSTPCLKTEQVKCAESIYFSRDGNEACSNYCPLECESQQYSFTISSSGYPSTNYANFLQTRNLSSKPSLNDLKSNTLRVSIFFDNNKNTWISESPQYKVYDIFSISK